MTHTGHLIHIFQFKKKKKTIAKKSVSKSYTLEVCFETNTSWEITTKQKDVKETPNE